MSRHGIRKGIDARNFLIIRATIQKADKHGETCKAVKWLRNLAIWILGRTGYIRVRDHLREQLTFAVTLGSWLGMLYVIDFFVADREISFFEIPLVEPLHFIEDVSLIFGLLISLAKVLRKEWRDK